MVDLDKCVDYTEVINHPVMGQFGNELPINVGVTINRDQYLDDISSDVDTDIVIIELHQW
jgi:hypothetical protein